MEEKEDIIYDIEGVAPHASQIEDTEEQGAPEESGSSDESESSESSESPENPESQESPEGSERSENSDKNNDDDGDSPAMEEIRRMVGEMGADTLLEIIRDNRNAVIRQIISEVETSQSKDLPSGGGGGQKCSSIFDLAALA